jgi:hypothetical protein
MAAGEEPCIYNLIGGAPGEMLDQLRQFIALTSTFEGNPRA